MKWQLTWIGSPDPECIIGGEEVELELVSSDGNTHIGILETDLEGPLFCRQSECQVINSLWSNALPVPEPTFEIGMIAVCVAYLMFLYFTRFNWPKSD